MISLTITLYNYKNYCYFSYENGLEMDYCNIPLIFNLLDFCTFKQQVNIVKGNLLEEKKEEFGEIIDII